MSKTEWFIFLFIFATINVALAIVKIVMGINAKIKTAGHIENRLPLAVIFWSAEALIGAFINTNLLYAGYNIGLPLLKDADFHDLINITTGANYVIAILSYVGSFMVFDYCDRKYGGHLRRLAIILISSKIITSIGLRILAVKVLRLTTPDTIVPYTIVVSLPVIFDIVITCSLISTFLRNREKEEVYKSIYIFYILTLVKEAINIGLSIFMNMIKFPEIVSYLFSFALGFLGLAYAIYVFVCARNAHLD